VLAYAEYDGQRIALIDHEAAGCATRSGILPLVARFTISTLSEGKREPDGFPCQQLGRDVDVVLSDDEAKARRVFAEEAERLRLTTLS